MKKKNINYLSFGKPEPFFLKTCVQKEFCRSFQRQIVFDFATLEDLWFLRAGDYSQREGISGRNRKGTAEASRRGPHSNAPKHLPITGRELVDGLAM